MIFEDGNDVLEIGFNPSSDTNMYNNCTSSCFYGNPIESVYVGRNLSYSTIDSKGVSPFYMISTINNVTFGDSITTISPYLFSNCSGLSLAIIPKNVTQLGSGAFKGCKIEELYNYSPLPQSIEENTFDYYGNNNCN